MVTDEERDYMYRVYAEDPQARINLGIRRRLAPLLGNDRRRIELMNGLLFSLPGTPVLYYGDEIGMGDNIYLGDRNGVRTPMQWSADRNAGFSRANPQRLYLPVIIDPEYHYEAVNVEAQQRNPHSLLWWMRRLIALRKRHPAFGRGTLEFLAPRQPQGARLRAPARGRAHPRRGEPLALRAVRRAGPLGASRVASPSSSSAASTFPQIGDAPYFIAWARTASTGSAPGRPCGGLRGRRPRGPAHPRASRRPSPSSRRHAASGELVRALRTWLPDAPLVPRRARTIRGLAIVDTVPDRRRPGATSRWRSSR